MYSSPMTTRAPLQYRIADRANAVVWRAPAPRRLRAALSRVVYRNPPMPAARVVETLAALNARGIKALVMGGWGIAALVGRQQRPHRDLDLIVDHDEIDATLDALRDLGYEEWYRDTSPEPLGDVEIPGDGVVVRDAHLQVVDVHPVALAEANLSLGNGVIDGEQVLCISAEMQIRAHRGYTTRSRRERQNQEANLEAAWTALSGQRVNSADY
jgi:lincosamide nucleotidyltransferase A/C/D/E